MNLEDIKRIITQEEGIKIELKDTILRKKDFAAGKERYTLAAALIFGKDQTIQSILPAYKVEA